MKSVVLDPSLSFPLVIGHKYMRLKQKHLMLKEWNSVCDGQGYSEQSKYLTRSSGPFLPLSKVNHRAHINVSPTFHFQLRALIALSHRAVKLPSEWILTLYSFLVTHCQLASSPTGERDIASNTTRCKRMMKPFKVAVDWADIAPSVSCTRWLEILGPGP